MHPVVKKLSMLLLALMLAGCSTTYVPVSFGQGDLAKKLSHEDPFLRLLFDRYDPQRSTLSVSGPSFDEVMMPSEVKDHLGAYRRDSKVIYRNLYQEYTRDQLCSLMLHEFSHHIWYYGMKQEQRDAWRAHMAAHPTALQALVRSTYRPGSDFDTEDFAFTVEHARPVDLDELATLQIITPDDRDALMALRFPGKAAAATGKAIRSSGTDHPTQLQAKEHLERHEDN
ncbi:hypothetical protein [Geomonas edaphica]|uniref:hypothetical protein n=1 Tax=Geomonas edaphica TaxID=2570226 RepID=UPI0010A75F46|nr:hypothetical protein [Geomonas edaphica]